MEKEKGTGLEVAHARERAWLLQRWELDADLETLGISENCFELQCNWAL
ncbi:hypothetical protein ERO13_D02G087000v2 [Gossypium hirsutum]|uniref:Uncharacterized protein n=1 Tax=Gossypium tomentosum TaxID=34277 RepID=A0A5D2LVN8_GOSTO|nr:hypothetical protein ERO13_D02G087000v2 [Gossypium hirsutum]TYH83126.1 hypothetical protein ES332_D02G110300v1 [Gossypium tomentosum]